MHFKKHSIEQIVAQRLKEIVKSSKYKKNNSCLYKKYNDYFFSILVIEAGLDNDIIRIRGNIKPYFVDDIFWDIMQMSSNKVASLSLRAVGAFSIMGVEVFCQEVQIKDLSEVSSIVDELIQKCDDEFLTTTKQISNPYESFVEFALVKKKSLDTDMIEVLTYIYNKDYDKAKKYAINELEKGNRGRFSNGTKFIYQLVVDYCNDK